MGEKQKGRSSHVPTSEQMRMAKLTLDSSTDDGQLQKLIKKVMETTRCTSAQAECALFDNENDAGRAIEYILDRDGDVECWTETKSRKAKKEDVEKEERRQALSSPPRRGRGSSSAISSRGAFTGPKRSAAPGNEGRSNGSRGSFGGVRGVGGRGGRGNARPSDPARYSVQAVEPSAVDDNSDWKTGPLIFEPSAAAQRASTSTASSSSAPKSWAEMAKKANDPPPPPQPEYVEHALHTEEEIEQTEAEAVLRPPSPEPEAHVAESLHDESAEWTRELKANLGIGDVSVHTAIEPVPDDESFTEDATPKERVEFVQAIRAAPLSEYHFGFSAPDPSPPVAREPAPHVAAPVAVSVQSVGMGEATSARYTAPRPPPMPVQPSPPHVVEEEVAKPSPPFSRGLSYETTSSVSYPPPDSRMRLSQHSLQQLQQPHQVAQQQTPSAPPQQPPQPQQPHPSQSQAPPSMFPPHMQTPYHSFPYMGMYNGMGGVRGDEQLAAFMYPYMGQIDITNILQQNMPAHHSVPPRTEHSEMNKYGGVRSENVAPPPGFGANTAFMTTAQPSLSSLLVQPQYASQYSMMNNMMGNRYEDDRSRGVGVGGVGGVKDGRVPSHPTHHVSHNTPPPHVPAYSHQSAQSAYMKKQPYVSGQWSNN